MTRLLCGAAIALALGIGSAQAGILLSDSTVFSSNAAGHNWNGWIWNTQGEDTEPVPPGRWNLYYSSSTDPDAPIFINGQNDSAARIAIDLAAGTHTFLVFGETASTTVDPLQHFVLNLYFGGNQTSPGISGLYGPDCPGPLPCPASHPNGLDLYGNSGAQEAGTLSYSFGGLTARLTKFTWDIDNVDKVWPYWANDVPYDNGSGTPDFVGLVELQVAPVPLPAGFALLGSAALALGSAGLSRRRRNRADA